MSFSEPVESVGTVDPRQFRLSVWHEGGYFEPAMFLSPDTSMCDDAGDYEGYLHEECIHDWDWEKVRQEFDAVKITDDGRVELRLNAKVGPEACRELTELAQDDPHTTLVLHYAGRADAALAGTDGRRVPDLSPAWVEGTPRLISTEAETEVEPPGLGVRVECGDR